MPFLSTSEFQQKLRDGQVLGIPREVIYQNLKEKGYDIEGDPGEQPTPETHGGVIGYFGATLKNALRELGTVAKVAGNAVVHPIQSAEKAVETGRATAEGIGRGIVGAGENIYQAVTGNQVPQFSPENGHNSLPQALAGHYTPGSVSYPESTTDQQVANSIGQGVKDAVQHPLETFKNHPLQTLSVAAPLVGGASKLAGLEKVANVAEMADPVNALTKGIPAAVRGVKKLGTELAGKMTGAGGGATEIASNVSSLSGPFQEGMRGDPLVQARQLASDAQQGLNALKMKRAAQYKKTSEAIRAITDPIDSTPIQKVLGDTMDEFRISPTEKDLLNKMKNMTDEQSSVFLQNMMSQPGTDSELSPLVKAGIGEGPTAAKISKAINYVEHWDDYTPDGLDRLQQSLNSLDPKPGSRESAFITKLKRGVQDVVKKKYPEYDKMMSSYHEASANIEELQSAIGNLDRSSIETTVRKLSQSMNTGNQGHEIRNAILKELENATGVKIRERIAGMAMNQPLPRGLAGVGAGVGTAAVVGQLISPTFLIGLAMSSPRVMGEVLSAIGVGKKYLIPVIEKLKTIIPTDASLRLMNVGAGADALNDATK